MHFFPSIFSIILMEIIFLSFSLNILLYRKLWKAKKKHKNLMHVYNTNSYCIVATDCWQLFSPKRRPLLSWMCATKKSCLKNNEILLRSNHVHNTHTRTHTYRVRLYQAAANTHQLKCVEAYWSVEYTQGTQICICNLTFPSIAFVCMSVCVYCDLLIRSMLWFWLFGPPNTHTLTFRTMDYLNELRWLSAKKKIGKYMMAYVTKLTQISMIRKSNRLHEIGRLFHHHIVSTDVDNWNTTMMPILWNFATPKMLWAHY